MKRLTIPQLASLCRIAVAVAQARPDRLETALRACHADDGISDAAVEEAILQGVPYAGFPGAIEAMGEWRKIAGARAVEETGAASENARELGAAVFHDVYGDVDTRVLSELRKRHPNLEAWILDFAYGRVLSRSELPLCEREALGVASLLGQERQAPLHSHLRGALRAGLSASDLTALLEALTAWCSPEIIVFARERL